MGAQVAPSATVSNLQDDQHPIIIERFTKGGRKLFYKLTVIQQPERARACGSGPKSSADRRPVDPPPVVELRIFEGQTWQEAQQKDITFLYNANFFLYATLEHARIMAHGRVQNPAANQPPVLTGMPVSGMAYLDRPVEAGYFLFPDLSVRHEGRYRLSFNLYEETKEDKDKDTDEPDVQNPNPGFSIATGGSFDFRMEVKSRDFLVFSAKKFPGLTESTTLSRVVAEQGCRVRIRRDVRMRRRDGKNGGDYDNAEDEYTRRRRTETPEIQQQNYRARSMSCSAERTPYVPDAQRRPSGQEYPPPPFNSQPSGAGGHLGFLGNPSAPQYPPQAQPYPQPPSMPPSPSYQTSHGGSFSHQVSHPPPTPQQTYSSERPPSQPYAPANPSSQREVDPRDCRRQLGEYSLPPPSVPAIPIAPAPAPSNEPSYRAYVRGYQPSTPITPVGVVLPPIQDASSKPPRGLAPAALASSTADISSLRAAGYVNSISQSMGRPLAPHPPVPSLAGNKRSRDQPSGYDADPAKYTNGAREDPQTRQDSEGPLVYQRADGTIKSLLNPDC